MKTRNKAKLNIFAMLGWLLWKLLALFGSRYAQKKLDERRHRSGRSSNPVTRGVRSLSHRSRR